MSDDSRKQEILDTLTSNWQEWENLLNQIGRERLTEPGVTGEWSVKDIAAHLAAWEERAALWTEGIRTNTKPPPAPWSRGLSEDEENASIYEMNRSRSLDDVLNGARTIRQRLMDGIRALSEDEVAVHKVEWLGDRTFADALSGNSYEHYRDHAALIETWLKKEPAGGTM